MKRFRLLKNNNEKRIIERYNISEYVKEDYYTDIYLEIRADRIYKAEITDISMNGLGFIINEPEGLTDIDELAGLINYYVKIHFQDKDILAEVKRIWIIISGDKGARTLEAGASFSVISSEDRLKLADVIATIRNME
jgi:hypothetical protein